MIDIHSHIIPAVDDGPPTWEASMALLRQGDEDGIKKVVATPHILSDADFSKQDEIFAKAEELQTRVRKEGLSIEILVGCELYVQPHLDFQYPLSTLNNNGRYFLVEFPMSLIPEFVEHRFFELIMEDKIPIIAHPERNLTVIKNVSRAFDFVKKDALLQVNAGSLLGRFGSTPKGIAFKLMNANLVHCIGSDCHHPKGRPLKLKAAYNLVAQNWGEERARALFIENPQKVINGEKIDVQEPIPFEEESVGFLQRFGFWKKK